MRRLRRFSVLILSSVLISALLVTSLPILGASIGPGGSGSATSVVYADDCGGELTGIVVIHSAGAGTVSGVYLGVLKTNTRSEGATLHVTSIDCDIVLPTHYEILWENQDEWGQVAETGFKFGPGFGSPAIPPGQWRVCARIAGSYYPCSRVFTVSSSGGTGVPDGDADGDADGSAANNPPICSFTIVPQSPTSSDTIVGTSTSVDLDGDTLTYSWYFDGEYDSSLGNSAGWQYKLEPGIWTIKLVVDDGRGGTDSHTKKVPVSAGPLSDGIISIRDQRDSSSPFLDTSVIRFMGAFRGGVPPYLYEWHFGDGYETGWLDIEEPGVVQASHQYDCPGRYRVLKVVQDAIGDEAYDEWTIEVRSTFMKEWNPDSGSLETVYPTISSEPVPGKYPDDFDHYYVKFTCHGVKGGYPPYDYYWDFGDGGITGTAFINDVAWVVHDYWSLGEYSVKVKVFDSCNSEVESSIPYAVAAEEEIGVLVVTSVSRLSSKVGASGWAQIEDRLNQLGWTILDVGSASVNAIDLQIEAKGANNVPKILILGGHDVVPFPILPNPTQDGDTLYTDDVYADFDHDPQTIIDVPIARIPDGGDLGLVLTQLFGSSSPSSGGFALAIYAFPGAQRIAEIFDGSMFWSRPTLYSGLDPGDIAATYDYFIVHGSSKNTTTWWGEDWVDKYGNKLPGTQMGDKRRGDKCSYPQAFKVSLADSTGVVHAACCYGAYVINKSPGDSICLRFLKNGARCFVGCTGINYGAGYEEYWLEIFAGPFDKMFFTKLVGGKTAMQAFYETKVQYAARATLSAEKKIMHQYVYYGRP